MSTTSPPASINSLIPSELECTIPASSGDEYMFFGFDGEETGVGYIEPFQAAYEFKEQILLGYTSLSFFDFDDKVLDPLRIQFPGNSYDLLQKNCNHFAKRLSKQLNLQQKFPKKIFRLTDFCNLFRCCIPECILNGRLDWIYPPNKSEEQSRNGQNDNEYIELQESVKDQIDIKMVPKDKHYSAHDKMSQFEAKDNVTTPTVEPQRKMSNQKHSQESLHSHDPKNTTVALRKGIFPHLENAHERVSYHEVPEASPKSLGFQNYKLDQGLTPKVEEYQQRYPKQDLKMFRQQKGKTERFSE